MNKRLCCVFTLIMLFIPIPGFSEEGEPNETDHITRELLQVSRLEQIGTQIMEQLIQFQKKKMPNLPDQFWKDVSEQMNIEGLNDKMVEIYNKHFSLKEMEEIISFYKTDTGQKYLKKIPEITKESMEAGRKWGMDLRMQITQILKEADLSKMEK